jgi:hypothetical protein
MTKNEIKEYIKDMKEYTKKVTSSPQKAKEFLSKTGVYTKKGKLSQNYSEGINGK